MAWQKVQRRKKWHLLNQDILKGLLILRNTPFKCGKTPVELMMGRIHRDILSRLQQTISSAHRPMLQERADAKRFHDKEISTSTGEWTQKGHIINIVPPRSFIIRIDNRNILRRNERHIRKLHNIIARRKRDGGVWGRHYNPCWKWQWHCFRLYHSVQWRKQHFCFIHGSKSEQTSSRRGWLWWSIGLGLCSFLMSWLICHYACMFTYAGAKNMWSGFFEKNK